MKVANGRTVIVYHDSAAVPPHPEHLDARLGVLHQQQRPEGAVELRPQRQAEVRRPQPAPQRRGQRQPRRQWRHQRRRGDADLARRRWRVRL